MGKDELTSSVLLGCGGPSHQLPQTSDATWMHIYVCPTLQPNQFQKADPSLTKMLTPGVSEIGSLERGLTTLLLILTPKSCKV